MFDKRKLKPISDRKASEVLENIASISQEGKTKIQDIVEQFHENGILLAMIFFALPIAIPLPYPPGFTTIVGIPLITLSVQMLVASKQVNLPKRITEYSINNSTLSMMSKKIIPFIKFVEKYTKPRISAMGSVYAEQLIGLISLISSICIAIPLPFTNSIPAMGITVMALGLMNKDGVVTIAGILIAIIGVMVATVAVFMVTVIGAAIGDGWNAIKHMFL